jgi:hypothetical protein
MRLTCYLGSAAREIYYRDAKGVKLVDTGFYDFVRSFAERFDSLVIAFGKACRRLGA